MSDWFVQWFCPILGTTMADFMWVVSIGAVLECRKNQSLGALDPIPFVMMMANCIIWVIYSMYIKDYFVFMANFPGIILPMFYTITAMVLLGKAGDEESERKYLVVERMFMTIITVYTILSLFVGITITDTDLATTIVGSTAMGVNILYYASPCNNLINIWKTGDASGLYLPMLLANLGTALCWFFYSMFALNDVFIYGPNCIGIVLTSITITTKLYLGDKPNDGHTPLLKTDEDFN
jgi:solute carrier family 50 (sugar transporter)